MQKPSNLTKHGVKQICESADVSQEFANTHMILQVVDVTNFDDNQARKNVKARISLSDGQSKIIAMMPDKVY